MLYLEVVLGEYKYYDMDAVVAAALDKAEERL